ncbi:hypothetical protein OUZ56_007372 [Daphnia magna]|uniref:Uncharacterized protein n=1 Tax=Daphnia magna TaxID=35525 RepID=A0ABR0AA64_9CRUS|nr:hypothetical protein OUZ56_007372 [Daphnia magna]
MSRGAIATRAGLKVPLTRTIDKINQYKNVSMTAKLDNDLAIETELLKQRYQKFIKASDQVRWTLQSTNATKEQIEQDYSTVAEFEEEMSMVLVFAKNKRDEYKRKLDAVFQDQQRKDELKRDVKRRSSSSSSNTHAFPKGKSNILKEISLSGRHSGRALTPPFTRPQCLMSENSDLKEYIKGKAYLCVENLELTAANYNIAIAELKRVYAKPKAIRGLSGYQPTIRTSTNCKSKTSWRSRSKLRSNPHLPATSSCHPIGQNNHKDSTGIRWGGKIEKLEEGQPKVLGIRWDTESDPLQFDPAPIIEFSIELGDLVTKRKYLEGSKRILFGAVELASSGPVMRKTVITTVASVEPGNPVEWQLDRFKSWNRLLSEEQPGYYDSSPKTVLQTPHKRKL